MNKLEDYQNLNDKAIMIGGDHWGHELALHLFQFLRGKGVKAEFVRYSGDNADYISQVMLVASRVSNDPKQFAGILACKSGFGMSVLSNKFPNVFSVMCSDEYFAEQSRLINYCNLLALGSAITPLAEAEKIVEKWLNTNFEMSEKNLGRFERIKNIQKKSDHPQS